MLWQIKLLPANQTALERLEQRSSRASPKKFFLFTFGLFFFASSLDRVQEVSTCFFVALLLQIYKFDTGGFTDHSEKAG